MFWTLLLLLLLLLVLNYYLHKPVIKPFHNIPLVSESPLFGSLIALLKIQPDNLHLKFKEYVERYGRSFHARIFGALIVVTADANYARELLSSNVHTRKHMLYNMLSSWLGNGLLLSDSGHWFKMRKIITPTFHFNMLEQFVRIFDSQSMILVRKMSKYDNGNTVVDIYKLMGLMTLDVIAEAAMHIRLDAQLNAKSEFVQSVDEVTQIMATRFVRPHLAHPSFLRIFAPSWHKQQQEGITYMHEFTGRIIEERRKFIEDQLPSKGHNIEKGKSALLDVLLKSKINGNNLHDKEVRDEVNTFMFEGHDTTASATSFCLYLISRHSDCQQKLINEIVTHFGENPKRDIVYGDLNNLNYLNCVIKESLRLFPPIPAIGRWLKEDFTLSDGNCLPGGTNIIVILWQMMRDPVYFPDPESFIPERHLENFDNPCSYIPFSMGPRNCIGQRFALLEMKTIVINVLRNYEIFPLGEAVQPSIKIVLRSKTGVQMGVKPRNYSNLTV